nr:sex determination protein fruitless-like [Onthophagus taurus]
MLNYRVQTTMNPQREQQPYQQHIQRSSSSGSNYGNMFVKVGESPTTYSCNFCGKLITNRWHHSAIHKPQNNRCPWCSQVFSRKDNLKSHVRIKHGGVNLDC